MLLTPVTSAASCDLHRETADATRSAIDQHALAGLQPTLVPQRLQRGGGGDGKRGRLGEADVVGYGRNGAVFTDHDMIRKGTVATAEDSVAWLELADLAADGCHRAGKVDSQAQQLW